MDHHCPYLNNCVGRGNLRHFLLFLFWVTVAMMYAIPVFGFSMYAHKSELFRVRSTPRRPPFACCVLWGSTLHKNRSYTTAQILSRRAFGHAAPDPWLPGSPMQAAKTTNADPPFGVQSPSVGQEAVAAVCIFQQLPLCDPAGLGWMASSTQK